VVGGARREDDRATLIASDRLANGLPGCRNLTGLGHAADATDEVDKRTTSRVPSNPWQHAVVAWNLEHNISLNRAAMTSGSFPSPIPARSSHAMPMFFFFHFE
jgi:hypothetical protein